MLHDTKSWAFENRTKYHETCNNISRAVSTAEGKTPFSSASHMKILDKPLFPIMPSDAVQTKRRAWFLSQIGYSMGDIHSCA